MIYMVFIALFFSGCSHIVLPMELSKAETHGDPIQFLLDGDPENTKHPVRSAQCLRDKFMHAPDNDDLYTAAWRKHNLLVLMKKRDLSDGAITQAFEYGKCLSQITEEMVENIDLHDLKALQRARIICAQVLRDVKKYAPKEKVPREYSTIEDLLAQNMLVGDRLHKAIRDKEHSGVIYLNVPRDATKPAFDESCQLYILCELEAQLKPAQEQIICIEIRTADPFARGISPLLQQLLEKRAQNTITEKERSSILYLDIPRQLEKARFFKEVGEGIARGVPALFKSGQDQIVHIKVRTKNFLAYERSPVG